MFRRMSRVRRVQTSTKFGWMSDLAGLEENVVEREADFDGLGEAFRRQRIAALDLVKIDAADDRNVSESTRSSLMSAPLK